MHNPERYQIIELTDEESKIILNKDADCDIFATVVDDDENSKKVFFNCQTLKNRNAKPSIIIHVIQKEPQKRLRKQPLLLRNHTVHNPRIISNTEMNNHEHAVCVTNGSSYDIVCNVTNVTSA
ncbi:unnamed protein product [Rhizophagus irregularis]|nr:unnamed protein product [Rhizophagus irregularis]CAB5369954.1 unnamed protein product [Rhizophagus irregularis]